ncbi:MAG: hypothetical protein U1E65_29405 [Myxococcota bacterium]
MTTAYLKSGERLREARKDYQDLRAILRRVPADVWVPAARDLSQAELLEMATSCEVRFDFPSVEEDLVLTQDDFKRVALTDGEIQRVVETIESEKAELSRRLREILEATTGEPSPERTPQEYLDRLERAVGLATTESVRARLLRQRAGLPSRPLGRGPLERAYEAMMNAGDGLEERLGATIGAERALQLRNAHHGWPGRYWSWMDGCEDGMPD